MAEQRPDEQRGPDEQPAGEAGPGSDMEPAAPSLPQQLDADQLRQFQQFQKFQDFLRYNEARRQAGGELTPGQSQQPAPTDQQAWLPARPPPPGGPPQVRPEALPAPLPKAPRWLRRLGGKLLSLLLLLIILGIAGKIAYNHFFPADDEGRPASETGGGKYHATQLLAKDPHEAVRDVYDAIAQKLVPQACGRFDEPIQQQFAVDMGFADCQQAVLELNKLVTNKNAYAESLPSYISEPLPGNTVQISSCFYGVTGGRSLGAFTVQKVDKEQWLIIGHANEPDPCTPAKNPSTSPTATPTG